MTENSTTIYTVKMNAGLGYADPTGFYISSSYASLADQTISQSERTGFTTSWTLIQNVFNNSFGTGNSNDDWVTLGRVTIGEKNKFIEVIKSLVGVRGDRMWVIYRNNYDLIKSFSFNTTAAGFAQLMKAQYDHLFVPNYLTPALNKLGLSGSDLNQAEKLLVGSIQYNKGNINSYITRLKNAIKQHNLTLLNGINDDAFLKNNKVRRDSIHEFMNETALKNHLYRGVN